MVTDGFQQEVSERTLILKQKMEIHYQEIDVIKYGFIMHLIAYRKYGLMFREKIPFIRNVERNSSTTYIYDIHGKNLKRK